MVMATVKFDPPPCPPPRQASRASLATSSLNNRLGKPRRPLSSKQTGWDIHEDTFEFVNRPLAAQDGSRTTNSLARRPNRPSLSASTAQRQSLAPLTSDGNGEFDAKRRRLSSQTSLVPTDDPIDEPTIALKSVPENSELKREPRRRTIWVPPPQDDTTIFTIHPGASLRENPAPRRPRRSDIFLDIADGVGKSEEEEKEAQQPRRTARKSLLAAPKRGPLQQTCRQVNTLPTITDVAGSGDGKENIPPNGIILGEGLKSAKSTAPTVLHSNARHRESNAHLASKIGPASLLAPLRNSNKQPEINSPPLANHLRKTSRHSIVPRDEVLSQSRKHYTRPSFSSRASSVHQTCENHPAIPEQILEPRLYEENWLNQQETAIAELINNIFADIGAATPSVSQDPAAQRQKILDIYHSSALVLLHKRIQASLRFGALSVPHEKAAQVARFKNDLGQRQRFIDLWTKTYNPEALQVVLEVVVGREVSKVGAECSMNGSKGKSPQSVSKTLSAFLRKFLILNEDAPLHDQCSVARRSTMTNSTSGNMDVGSTTWMWRRTVLRSLMVILLLDQGYEAGIFHGCLFQPSSPFKASTTVLQALAALLIPSIGDVVRTLAHLHYNLSRIQYPLEERSYHVENLATDFRDGVFLTRLVETFLYPPALLLEGNDVTITLPTGEVLSPTTDRGDGWVLSHLKYPCTGRVQQLYNVQIALGGLADRDAGNLIEGITAEDIVDGHREKTVRLLWSLVGRWGLAKLVNVAHLDAEIRRLDGRWARFPKPRSEAHDTANDIEAELLHAEGSQQITLLLKLWAVNVGRLHGVAITNLSTSFANREAFKAIVKEYASALPDGSTCTSTTLPSSPQLSRISCQQKGPSLTRMLRNLGCSSAFIGLFLHTSGIPTAQTTVPLLAFLASRVLPAGRSHYSAVTIQRSFRRHLARIALRKRLTLWKLARDCALVVGTRERIVAAAITIQKWWRAASSL